MSELNFNDLNQVVGGVEDEKPDRECEVKPCRPDTWSNGSLLSTLDREYNQGGLEVKEWDSQRVYHV